MQAWPLSCWPGDAWAISMQRLHPWVGMTGVDDLRLLGMASLINLDAVLIAALPYGIPEARTYLTYIRLANPGLPQFDLSIDGRNGPLLVKDQIIHCSTKWLASPYGNYHSVLSIWAAITLCYDCKYWSIPLALTFYRRRVYGVDKAVKAAFLHVGT